MVESIALLFRELASYGKINRGNDYYNMTYLGHPYLLIESTDSMINRLLWSHSQSPIPMTENGGTDGNVFRRTSYTVECFLTEIMLVFIK